MSHKNKNIQPLADQLRQQAHNFGLGLMAVAATAGMMELPDHPNRVALTTQPVYVSINEELNNPLRREREEETAAHSFSFAVVQRSHAVAGKK